MPPTVLSTEGGISRRPCLETRKEPSVPADSSRKAFSDRADSSSVEGSLEKSWVPTLRPDRPSGAPRAAMPSSCIFDEDTTGGAAAGRRGDDAENRCGGPDEVRERLLTEPVEGPIGMGPVVSRRAESAKRLPRALS